MRILLGLIGLVVAVVLVSAPLLGWTPVVRLPAVLVPALTLAVLAMRPWRWREADFGVLMRQPSTPQVLWPVLLAAVSLFWYILTRFYSGEINAVDFTVYFDRPCFQTVQGRPLFVEVSDTPGFSYRSELADHAYWAMLPICTLYVLSPSPLWLHGISAVAVSGGALLVLRILQHLGASGVLAVATALAFILNDNTARALNYGFHPEVLYALIVPWMIYAGLLKARRSFLLAMCLCVLVKEDACLPIFAVSVGLALQGFWGMSRGDRFVFLVLPNVLAVSNLCLYYGVVSPMLTGRQGPTYAHFWANYGETPFLALIGMLSHPGQVLASALTSGISRVVMPHLFLPIIGWKWALGIVPIILIYGASANLQVRAFGIYYPIVLVPFLVLSSATGALILTRRLARTDAQAQIAAATLVLLGSLLVGSWHRGYSLRPWRASIAALPQALSTFANEPVVLVQSGLFPHAGYDERFRLLTPETLADPRHEGAPVILAERLGAYPFKREDLAHLRALPRIRDLPGRLIVVRLPGKPIR